MKPVRMMLFCFVICFSVFAEDLLSTESPLPNEKQNVIWIVLDACRATNLSCYGYFRNTSPNIDLLASCGTVFEKHYSQSSKTFYSVPSFMTGKYFPIPCFSRRYSRTFYEVLPPEGEELLGETFRKNGYTSVMFTNMPLFLETDRLARSFDSFFCWEQGEKVLLQRWAVMNETIHKWLAEHKEKPFFMYIHAADTHFPHEMISPYDQWIDPNYDESILLSHNYGQNYSRRDGNPFEKVDYEYLLGMYDGSILDADTQIGLLINELKDLNLFDNTIFIIGSDHGQLLGEDGYTVAHCGGTDEVLHIPLILSGPGIPKGLRVNELTENVDIVPTLVDLVGLKTNAYYDGKKLNDLWNFTLEANWRQQAFSIPDRLFYESPQNFVFITHDKKIELDEAGIIRSVFTMPDYAGKRNQLTDINNVVIDTFQTLFREHYLPLLNRFQSLPKEYVVLDSAWLAEEASPREYVVNLYVRGIHGAPNNLQEDNKWAYTEGYLWARNDKERVPPLNLEFKIPNGEYNVFATLFNSINREGAPCSSLVIEFPGDEFPREMVLSTLPTDQAADTKVPIGTVTISDGLLRFSLSAGNSSHWTMFKRLELFPTEHYKKDDSENIRYEPHPSDSQEYEELIRGLGYL